MCVSFLREWIDWLYSVCVSECETRDKIRWRRRRNPLHSEYGSGIPPSFTYRSTHPNINGSRIFPFSRRGESNLVSSHPVELSCGCGCVACCRLWKCCGTVLGVCGNETRDTNGMNSSQSTPPSFRELCGKVFPFSPSFLPLPSFLPTYWYIRYDFAVRNALALSLLLSLSTSSV